jgi:hypothetical protein
MASKPTKWTPVDLPVARNLTNETSTPGLVYPVGTNAVPPQIQLMPGAVSYFVSNYVQTVPLSDGVTAGGEIVNVRHDRDTAKAYNHVFATSSDGGVYFGGLYKGMPTHHFATSSPVAIESFFGNPLTKRKP